MISEELKRILSTPTRFSCFILSAEDFIDLVRYGGGEPSPDLLELPGNTTILVQNGKYQELR